MLSSLSLSLALSLCSCKKPKISSVVTGHSIRADVIYPMYILVLTFVLETGCFLSMVISVRHMGRHFDILVLFSCLTNHMRIEAQRKDIQLTAGVALRLTMSRLTSTGHCLFFQTCVDPWTHEVKSRKQASDAPERGWFVRAGKRRVVARN